MERTLITYSKLLFLLTLISTQANPISQVDICFKMTTVNGHLAITSNGIIVDKSMYPDSALYDFTLRQPSCTAESAVTTLCNRRLLLPQIESAGYEATLGSAANSKLFLAASCDPTKDKSLHVVSYAVGRGNVQIESHFDREYLNNTSTFILKRPTSFGPNSQLPTEECYISVQPDYTLAAAYYSTVPLTEDVNGNPVKNSIFQFELQIVNCP